MIFKSEKVLYFERRENQFFFKIRAKVFTKHSNFYNALTKTIAINLGNWVKNVSWLERQ